jgi:hypothetical protein
MLKDVKDIVYSPEEGSFISLVYDGIHYFFVELKYMDVIVLHP